MENLHLQQNILALEWFGDKSQSHSRSQRQTSLEPWQVAWFMLRHFSGLPLRFAWVWIEWGNPLTTTCNNNKEAENESESERKQHLDGAHHLHKGVAESAKLSWARYAGTGLAAPRVELLTLKSRALHVKQTQLCPRLPLSGRWHVDWAKLIAISYASPPADVAYGRDRTSTVNLCKRKRTNICMCECVCMSVCIVDIHVCICFT